MPAMLSRPLHIFNETGAAAESESRPRGDRRCRARVVVHWPLIFRDHSGAVSEVVTGNLSSQGLYFETVAPFIPGEVLTGSLMVPAHNPENSAQVIVVKCRFRILRIESLAGNCFGIGCRIEEFHVHSCASATASHLD
jgi:hypothetical protein